MMQQINIDQQRRKKVEMLNQINDSTTQNLLKANSVEKIICGVNKSVVKLKNLKQFKKRKSNQKIENKSEESFDETKNSSHRSLEKAIKHQSIYTMSNVGKSIMRSTMASWSL